MCFFFFNDTATTEIYTLSLHDALPICGGRVLVLTGTATLFRVRALRDVHEARLDGRLPGVGYVYDTQVLDRKSTRLNSSHANISYAVFCLKKKKKIKT